MWSRFPAMEMFIVEKISTARNWLCAILLMFALNAFSLNFGCISPTFSRFCGLLSLVAVIFIYGFAYKNISNSRKSIVGILLIIIALLLLLVPSMVEYWLISLPIFISGFDLVLRSSQTEVKELSVISLGCTFYAIFYIIVIHIPFFWLCFSYLSLYFSGIIGRLSGDQLALGPSVSGLWIFFAFFFCCTAFFLLSLRKALSSLKVFVESIGGLIIVQAGFLLLHAFPWMTGEMAIHSLYLPFILFTVPFLYFNRKMDTIAAKTGDLIPGPSGWAALSVTFTLFVLILVFPYSYSGSDGKVVIYQKDSEMSFDLPKFPEKNETFLPYSGFSVGALRLYLEARGYDVESFDYNTSSSSLNDSLRDADILIMLNLNKPVQSPDLDIIWSFVKNGGGLLLFGEHTSMFVSAEDFSSGKDYLNDLLLPTGIRVNPDTADYLPGNWKYAAQSLPHVVTRGLGFGIETSSVGASLSLSGNARPVMIGRYGFSDDPNPTASGHLGNRSYDKGEELGDLVIAASDTYGKGNVLVFGDTSYIFNSAIPSMYKLIDGSISFLMGIEASFSKFLPLISIILLLILGVFSLAPKRSLQISSISFQAEIALMIALSLLISGSINDSLIGAPALNKSEIAWIDHSHINEFDLEGYKPGSIDGLTTNLIRNGYVPLIIEEDFSKALEGDIFIIIAPTKRYTSSEVSLLDEFVKRGGMLFISAGRESREPLEKILKNFDISIGDLPLGSPPWIVETHGQTTGVVTPENLKKYWHKPKFMDAYPVYAGGAHDPVTWLEYENQTYNLILARTYPEGVVILIGDSHFLLNENLEYLTSGPGRETKESYQLQWLGNIELLRGMISSYKGDGT